MLGSMEEYRNKDLAPRARFELATLRL